MIELSSESVVVNDTMVKKPKKLLDQAQEKLRLKHYSIRTEKSYLGWMRRYIYFKR